MHTTKSRGIIPKSNVGAADVLPRSMTPQAALRNAASLAAGWGISTAVDSVVGVLGKGSGKHELDCG